MLVMLCLFTGFYPLLNDNKFVERKILIHILKKKFKFITGTQFLNKDENMHK